MHNRRIMEKAGLVSPNDNLQVDHIKPLTEGGSNNPSNLRVVSDRTNLHKEGLRKRRK